MACSQPSPDCEMDMRAACRCFQSGDLMSCWIFSKSTGTISLPPSAIASLSIASSPTS